MTGIKPTVSLFRAWQRELDGVLAHFSTTYTLYYCGYVLTLPWSSCYFSHVTHCDCDLWHDHPWPSITPIVTLWQSHVILSHTPSCSCKKRKEKKRKRKRNINNDLAVLPSHDTTPLLSFLVPRNFSTTYNIGLPCCLFHLYLPLSILVLLIFLL